MNVLVVVSGVLVVVSWVGLLAVAVQLAISWRAFRARPEPEPEEPGRPPSLGISILKPLCGADDDLAENLRQFATLGYPDYELILGVRSAQDEAYPPAVEAARRWPSRVKLVLQRGEPGLNPKVNQLCTLVEAASKPIILVSDSNCRPPEGYLEEIASAFESDPQVACTSNPIIGIGEQRLGSAVENLHLASVTATGVVAAKAMNRDIVVGKSMALRRADLEAMGGFFAVRNHLAEDYVLGKRAARIGKVRVLRRPVYQLSRRRTYRELLERHRRWSVLHRTLLSPAASLAQSLMNPLPFALVALLLRPSAGMVAAFAAAWAVKAALDWAAVRLHRPGFGLLTPVYVLLKDASMFLAWCNALGRRTVMWRGHRLRVERGSLLRGPAPGPSWVEAGQDAGRTAA
ncbi:MAG TPA: glycosyltransferase [Myxococcales bacterium]|nr:glycosyltransferase [Myxococcales bacterium]